MRENKVEMYLGYRVLWRNAMLQGDFESVNCYMDEMFKIMDEMNIDEVFESINQCDILDNVYRSYDRQR